jgi:hypothetical protein
MQEHGASPEGDPAVAAGAVELLRVSPVQATIPSADDIEPPRSADVYARTTPAIKVVAEAVGCDHERALEILKEIVSAGYFVAPRIPSDPMLYAYFNAYGQRAWSARSIIQNIGKARLRWQAMGQAGTALALSRRFLPAQGIAARSDEMLQAAQPEGQEPGPQSGCARTQSGESHERQ